LASGTGGWQLHLTEKGHFTGVTARLCFYVAALAKLCFCLVIEHMRKAHDYNILLMPPLVT